MAKLVLTDITTGYLTQDAYNDNNALIEAAFENTFSRDGTTPNEMNASMDMNSYNINNVANLNLESLTIDGVPYLPPGGVGVTTLAALTDVTDATPTIGNVLFGDGLGWASAPLAVVASNIAVQDEGTLVSANITTLNIVGADVIATNPTPGTVDLTFNNPTPLVYGGLIGSIQEWPLAIAPADHVECDGAFYDPVLYPDVFGVIGYQFGQMGSFFAVPDFRGYFLRGWDHGAGNDPDSASRTDRGDGTVGDNVGTLQLDDFKSHLHNTTIGKTASSSGAGGASGAPGSPVNTTLTGGGDTRPLNKNVMYIIRMNASAGFGTTPSPTTIIGAGVGVEYIGTGDGIQTSFGFADLLPADFSYAGVAIYLDGVRQSSSNYTATDGFNVVFNTAPANAVEIIIIANGDQVAPNPIGWTLDTNDPFNGTPINAFATGVVNTINYWVAVGNSGVIFTSDDEGTTWVQQTSGSTENLVDIEYNQDDELFGIAASGDGILISGAADITTWNTIGGFAAGDARLIAWFRTGARWNILHAGLPNDTKYSCTATGTGLTQDDIGAAMENGDQHFFYYTEDYVVNSAFGMDGTVSWSRYGSANSSTLSALVGNIGMTASGMASTVRVASMSALLVGPLGRMQSYELTTQQAIHDQAAVGDYTAVVYSPNNNRFVAVTAAGEITYLDDDATSWTTNDSEVLVVHSFDGTAFTDIKWDAIANKFIATTASGQIGWSSDGIT